ncbi:three component ABC system middle component [Stenotrophomonas oahuensis]|uniref:DUF6521 family protein n=1 Tax=Stenotrophomonas oahuensis TaxID=3003271 RepID=A0ABY9YUB5_9GAMM|nr:three component ABC system middle component [Stenotrophomonas sp. A5586]WNH54491.1 DUF6521 family protein [Stenotrophomonas sp. A5586]
MTDRTKQNPGRLSGLDLIYNPSLGSFLFWRAASGYFSECGRGLPVALAFTVLPIALHDQSRRVLFGTKLPSGLTLFAAKLGVEQESLLAIHNRTLALRSLSLASLTAGVMSEMLILDSTSATILSMSSAPPQLSPNMQKLGLGCEKLGVWFARIPIEQVASTLRVSF